MGKEARKPHGSGPDSRGVVLVCDTAPAQQSDASGVDDAGVPYRVYTKDLIKCGRWTIPDTGQNLDVDTARIDGWVDTFNRLTAAGYSVPVPDGHTFTADKNRGFVLAMFRDGDTLRAKMKLIGEDGIAAAARNFVSIYAPAKFKYSDGKTYHDAITHVALTPVPVIPGQEGFSAIAASLGIERVPVYRLSMEPTMNPLLLSLAAAMGVDPAACKSDQELHDAMIAKAKAGKPEPDKAMAASLATATADLKLAREELAELKKTSDPDPLVLSLSRDNRGMKIDGLVTAGKTTPAVAKALKAAWVPDDHGALKLSLSPAACSLFDATLAAIGQMDPKILGEQTRAQNAVALSRTAPGGDTRVTGEDATKAAGSLMGTIGVGVK